MVNEGNKKKKEKRNNLFLCSGVTWIIIRLGRHAGPPNVYMYNTTPSMRFGTLPANSDTVSVFLYREVIDAGVVICLRRKYNKIIINIITTIDGP